MIMLYDGVMVSLLVSHTAIYCRTRERWRKDREHLPIFKAVRHRRHKACIIEKFFPFKKKFRLQAILSDRGSIGTLSTLNVCESFDQGVKFTCRLKRFTLKRQTLSAAAEDTRCEVTSESWTNAEHRKQLVNDR